MTSNEMVSARPPVVRIPAVYDHPVRHRLVFGNEPLHVDHVHHRAEGDGDARRPPLPTRADARSWQWDGRSSIET